MGKIIGEAGKGKEIFFLPTLGVSVYASTLAEAIKIAEQEGK